MKSFLYTKHIILSLCLFICCSLQALNAERISLAESTFEYLSDDNACNPFNSSISKEDVSCNGGNDGAVYVTEPTTGVGPYTFLWNTGSTEQNLIGVPAGNYSVTITDRNGCTGIHSTNVAEPTPITVTYYISEPSCHGGIDGGINLFTSGGTPGYGYDWSNGTHLPYLQFAPPGFYTVTVTDFNQCQTIVQMELNGPEIITVNAIAINVSAPGANDGMAQAGPTGGTPPYTYEWTTGATTSTIANLAEGTYRVTVTDAHNCFKSQSVEVVYCSLEAQTFSVPISCHDGNDGSISVDVSGGQGPLTIEWNIGQTGPFLDDLIAGHYTVVVSDDVCSVYDTVVLVNPAEVEINAQITHTSCLVNNGIAEITVTGGIEPYSYLWSNGATNGPQNNLSEGFYTLTVTDANGCTAEEVFQIEVIDDEPPVQVQDNVDVYLDANGQFTDLGNLNHLFSDNCGFVSVEILSGSEIDCDNIGGGFAVEVLASDDNGNSRNYILEINVLDSLAPTLSCQENALSYSCVPSIFEDFITVSDNCSEFELIQINGPSTGSILSPGTYEIAYRARDESGNFTECAFNLEVVQGHKLDVTQNNISCNNFSDGSILIEIDEIPSPFMVEWNDGAVTLSRLGLSGGDYTITVTDANSCETVQTFSIINPEPLSSGEIVITPASDGTASDGSASVSISGGTKPYNFRWIKNGQTVGFDSLLNNVTAGTYFLRLTDVNGCTLDDIEVVINTKLSSHEIEKATDIKLFPNPVQELLFLDVTEWSDQVVGMELLTLEGNKKLINYVQDAGLIQVDVNNLPPAIYLIKLTGNRTNSLVKFVKQ